MAAFATLSTSRQPRSGSFGGSPTAADPGAAGRGPRAGHRLTAGLVVHLPDSGRLAGLFALSRWRRSLQSRPAGIAAVPCRILPALASSGALAARFTASTAVTPARERTSCARGGTSAQATCGRSASGRCVISTRELQTSLRPIRSGFLRHWKRLGEEPRVLQTCSGTPSRAQYLCAAAASRSGPGWPGLLITRREERHARLWQASASGRPGLVGLRPLHGAGLDSSSTTSARGESSRTGPGERIGACGATDEDAGPKAGGPFRSLPGGSPRSAECAPSIECLAEKFRTIQGPESAATHLGARKAVEAGPRGASGEAAQFSLQ